MRPLSKTSRSRCASARLPAGRARRGKFPSLPGSPPRLSHTHIPAPTALALRAKSGDWLGISWGARASKQVGIRRRGTHRLQISGHASTPGGPAHAGRRSPQPDAVAPMECLRRERLGNRARGQGSPGTAERAAPSEFGEKWGEKQGSDPSLWISCGLP